MSYIQYLKLYTRKSNKRHNNRKVVKRGQKNNYWLHLLKINDKLDIYDGQKKGDKCWHIGTVIKIEKNNKNETNFLIHYDGWGHSWDEWINIDHSIAISSKLKKLNTITPYHDYLSNVASISMKPCKWKPSSKWKKCNVCNIKCCTKCFITKVDDKCKKCMKTINYQNLFNPIYSSIYNQYEFDINIIHLITEYSTGITIQCSNTNKPCLNDINFETQYEMENNLSISNGNGRISVYQYCAKYIHSGSITIYGKNRRIFCESCTKNELFDCSKCGSREAKNCGIRSRFCHNHHFVECVVCKQKYDEGDVCWFCQINHCTLCVAMYCIKCHRCKFSVCLLKCEQCEKYICDECGKYNKCNECGIELCIDCGLSLHEKECEKTCKKKQDAISDEEMDDMDMDDTVNKSESESEMNDKKRKLDNVESPQPKKRQRTR